MNKKIFITLFAFIGFIFFFNCSNVFASYDVTVDGTTYSLPDLPEPNSGADGRYCLIYSDLTEYISVDKKKYITFKYLCDDEPLKLGDYESNYTGFYCTANCSVYTFYYGIDSVWSAAGKPSIYDSVHNTYFMSVSGFPKDGSANPPILITNHGITAKDSDVTVFYPAPQEEEPAPTPTLTLQVAPTLTSTDLSGILAQILAILPVVLMVLISLLALRKAIRLLLRILGQA